MNFKIKNPFKKLWNYIEEKRYNPYCKLCTSCGEEGCCSPISCMYKCMVDERPRKCRYGSGYADDLWFSYELSKMYQHETYRLKEKEITLEEFLDITEKRWHEIYDKCYADQIKANQEYWEKWKKRN